MTTENNQIAEHGEYQGEVLQTQQLVAYAGEVQLVDSTWRESSGYISKFLLHESDEGGHPLKRFGKGTRFQLVLVEVDDDEEPIDQVMKQKIERYLKSQEKGGKHSKEAGMLCKARDFQAYLYRLGKISPEWDEKMREEAARMYVYKICGIKSRRELDHDEHKAAAFKTLIVLPFLKWGRENQAALQRRPDNAV